MNENDDIDIENNNNNNILENDENDENVDELNNENNINDNEEENEDNNLIVRGRRRSALAKEHDPERILREKVREYYGRGARYDAPTCIHMLWLLQGVYKDGSRIPQDIIWQIILGNINNINNYYFHNLFKIIIKII